MSRAPVCTYSASHWHSLWEPRLVLTVTRKNQTIKRPGGIKQSKSHKYHYPIPLVFRIKTIKNPGKSREMDNTGPAHAAPPPGRHQVVSGCCCVRAFIYLSRRGRHASLPARGVTPGAQRRHRCSFAYWPRSYARRPRRRPGTPPWVAKPHTPADVLAVCSLVISASSGSENWLRYACS